MIHSRRHGVLYWLAAVLACTAIQVSSAGAADERPVVLFLGTSLTAGYGLPSDEAFPALLQKRMDEAGLRYRVVNAGVSGDTSAGGLRRIDWLLKMPVAVLVLELGANDMLRGLAPAEMKENLQKIIDRTRKAHPDVRVVVAGMRAMRNLGSGYADEFEAAYPALARQNDAVLIPFLLEGVAGKPRLNLADDVHPNAEGQKRISAVVWPSLEPILRNPSAGSR